MTPNQRAQFRLIAIWTIAIAITHFALGTDTHREHAVHILLAGASLVPVVMAAVAFGVRGGLWAALVVGTLYLAHLIWSWQDSPLGNADQFAMIGVYFVVGAITGRFVDIANRQKHKHDQIAARFRKAQMVSGLNALLASIGARDLQTREHCERVAELCAILAKRMNLPADRISDLRLAGLVHDAGKIGLQDDVLFSEGVLSREQRLSVRQHAELAADMIESILGMHRIAETVRAHHECPDGSGYPRGLKGAAISVDAGVLRVADVFTALTEKRRYKRSLSSREALEIMRPMAGTEIDATAFATLEDAVNDGLVGAGSGETDDAGPAGTRPEHS